MKNASKVFAAAVSSMMIAFSGSIFAGANAKSPYEDFEQFYSCDKSILLKQSNPKKLLKLPKCRQSTPYTCGASCVQSVLRYVSYQFDVREGNLLEALDSNENTGTRPEKMIGFLNAVRLDDAKHQYFKAELKENMTVNDLIKEIDKKHPIICEIQAWDYDKKAEKYSMNLNYKNKWENNHWAIVVGYDKYNIILMDPNTCGSYTYIPREKFAARWHGYSNDANGKRKDHVHAGIVVTIDADEIECEKYANNLYGLM